ncbi:PulJ/GspJ family protein [Singulisphaera rosea]
MKARRGYTLIELLVVISSLGIVMGICVAILYSLMKLDRVGRAHLAQSMTRDRLSHQFRKDVHAAHVVTPKAELDSLSATLELGSRDGRVVTYEAKGKILARSERLGNQLVRGESYPFPTTPPQFRVSLDDGTTFVSMVGPRSTVANGPRERPFQIDVSLGRDDRFGATPEAVR